MIEIEPPAVPDKGPKWLRKFFQESVEFACKTRLYDINAAVNSTPKGLSVSISRESGAATPAEFALYDASTTTGGIATPKIGVKFGTIIPYAISAVVFPWPDNFTEGTGYQCQLAAGSGIQQVWIKVTNDDSGVTTKVSAVTIEKGNSMPESTALIGYCLLGVYQVVAGKMNVLSGALGIGCQFYARCGSYHWFYAA